MAHFHGSPPSAVKYLSDLNPIWGTHGRISVHRYSDHSYMIYIPLEATRKWVLEVAFWQSDNCAFTVTNWTSSVCKTQMKLDVALL